ncbi:hypothetical protein [Vallitalea maricola]|uniref:Uncharacterized protein n=1 Tax=Vallitalea maricola TaxID=3074433 RepID=A0ACB5UMK2_9FIRM|nr:hypothetical protein AN2V17_34410 [Vallitalea sp. AN17-2]
MKKFIALCVTSFILFFNVSPSFAAGWGGMYDNTWLENDEPNNTMDKAEGIYALKERGKTDELVIYGTVDQEDREDWFKVRSDFPSAQGWVYLRELDNIKHKVYIYDKNGQFISQSHDWSRGQEISNIYIRQDEVYYIRVVYQSGGNSVSPYELSFTNAE